VRPIPTVTIQQAFELALQHHQSGRIAEAEAIYMQILAVDPRHAGALHLLGVIAHQNGRHEVALDLIRRAIALVPGVPDFHCNIGEVLRALGQLDAAIAACRQAIALKPNLPEAHMNLGNALRDAGRLDEAIAAHRQAIALRPGYPDAHSNLGNALRDQGQLNEAIAAYRQAIALNPNFPEAHNNLGAGLWKNGQSDEAIAAYRRAIALKPNYPEAHSNLGAALCDRGQLDEAIAAYRQAITLKPNYPDAHSNLGIALWTKGELDEATAAYRQAIALKPDFADAHSNLLLALHCHPGFDARAIAEEHHRWNRQHAEPLRQFIQPHPNDRTPDRRLRIGYVSPDFREHPVGRFLLPLLAEHDHQNFEIFCYAQVHAPDALTGQLRAHANHWHSLTGLSDEQAAALIRNHQIDILVDLSGHTAHHRLLVFARKPAPVQVTFLGYPDTTGLTTMDYRLTDAYADPPGQTESCHSEQLIRLPCAWCYQPAHRPEIAARRDGPIIFGCCNKLAKITEPMLALWARILRAVPESGLLLKAPALGSESTRQHVRRKLEKAGIALDRVELRGYEPSLAAHLALYDRITIALDTFPYHGTTTTCEALWMGVPVVTLAGTTHVSRVGVSLLSNVGLPDLVAASEEQYVQLAVSLANHPQRLTDLRGTLRQRLDHSPLLDAPRYARDIEAAFREMWCRWSLTGA
jgi:predicted O-linked N-acetylglucosamine transferase (SPINDLY family)